MRTTLERIGVVVPAHQEQDRLPACLAALQVAAAGSPVPVELLVVADACTDATVPLARAAGAGVLEIDARNVGAARAAGWRQLCPSPAPGIWLATTDADTLVPPDWLARMVAYADAGWDAVVGTVQVDDWAEAGRSDRLRRAWLATYVAAAEHVHGANLGVRASSYAAVGGVPEQTLSEDAGLVQALRDAGQRVRYASDIPVVTSARSSDRAPGGFASYLDGLEQASGA